MSFATQQQQQQQQLHNGMKPNFYNQHSSTQGNAVELCRHLLLQAAQQMPLPTETAAVPDDADLLLKAPPASSCCCINVAEWGCSHGGNSIAPVVLIAEVLQQRLAGACGSTRAAEQATQGSTDTAAAAAAAAAMKTAAEAAELPPQQQQQQQQEVHISHVDVPNNDFSSLFACTQQYSAAIQHACPLLHVTSSAVGGSMYARNFPRRSLNLGFSFSTLHWQSSRAVRLSGTVSPGCSKTLPEEHTVLREHAMADLARFLALRAQELRPGGLLLLCYPGCSDDAPLQSMAFHDAAQAVAEGMVADGLLQQEDLGSMAAPVYFLDEPSQREVYAAVADAWELQFFDIVNNVSPSWKEFQQGRASNEQQAAVFVNFWRAVAEPFMQEGLSRPTAGRTVPDVAALLETFFSRMTAAALLNPQPPSFPAVRVLLRRTH